MKLTTAIVDRIVVKAEFDPDSESWWATADIDARHTLTTGAPTLDELLERIPAVLRDLLVDAYPNAEIPFSIVVHKLPKARQGRRGLARRGPAGRDRAERGKAWQDPAGAAKPG
jgi:hypothetical protein